MAGSANAVLGSVGEPNFAEASSGGSAKMVETGRLGTILADSEAEAESANETGCAEGEADCEAPLVSWS